MSPARAIVSAAYIIVGAGAAGLAAVRAIRRRDPLGRIVVLTAETGPSYSPALLPYLVAGRVSEPRIHLADSDFFASLGVERVAGARVVEMDADRRVVYLDDGRSFGYTRLLAASGASARGEEVPGVGSADTPLTLRTLADARVLRERLLAAPAVTVLGAGLAGLEIAMAARALGKTVTVVAASPQILSRNATSADADVVRGWLEESGVRFLCDRRVAGLERGARGVALRTTEDEALPADVLVAAKGAAPNTDWLAARGGGLEVDATMRTVVPDVFAAGDAAVVAREGSVAVESVTTWPSACAQGDAAGINMAGGRVRMPPEVPWNVLPVFERRVAFIGCTSAAALRSLGGNVECTEIGRPAEGSGARLWHRDGRLVGAVVFGSHSGVGALKRLIGSGAAVGSLRGRSAWSVPPVAAVLGRGLAGAARRLE